MKKKQSTKNTMGKITCVTVAAMSCVGLVGCGTRAKDVMKHLKEGKLEEALSKYDDADWADGEKSKFKDQLREYMSQLVNDYAAGTITYEEVIEIMQTISDMNINKMEEDIATTSSSIAALHSSKSSYENGLSEKENGNYIIAKNLFLAVIESDINYEDAQKQIAEVEKLQFEKIKKEMFAEVEQYISEENYASVFDTIENFIDVNGSDSEVDNKYAGYVKEYVALITDEVEGLIDNKEFLTALEVLNNAQEVVSNDKFIEMMENIEKLKPTYFSEIDYQSSKQFERIEKEETVQDTFGNTYTSNGNLYEMTNSRDSWDGEVTNGSVEYFLGQEYSSMRFIVAVDSLSQDVGSVMTVYGDDVALYNISLNRKTAPTEVVVDVSNVNYLKIKLEGHTNGQITDTNLIAIILDGSFEK